MPKTPKNQNTTTVSGALINTPPAPPTEPEPTPEPTPETPPTEE